MLTPCSVLSDVTNTMKATDTTVYLRRRSDCMAAVMSRWWTTYRRNTTWHAQKTTVTVWCQVLEKWTQSGHFLIRPRVYKWCIYRCARWTMLQCHNICVILRQVDLRRISDVSNIRTVHIFKMQWPHLYIIAAPITKAQYLHSIIRVGLVKYAERMGKRQKKWKSINDTWPDYVCLRYIMPEVV